MKRHLLSTLTLSLMAAFATAADLPKAAAPGAPTSGIDVQNIDPAVRPQDDMFAHLNGNWIKKVDIPAERSSWGTFAILIPVAIPLAEMMTLGIGFAVSALDSSTLRT